jgi:hypothetical protein
MKDCNIVAFQQESFDSDQAIQSHFSNFNSPTVTFPFPFTSAFLALFLTEFFAIISMQFISNCQLKISRQNFTLQAADFAFQRSELESEISHLRSIEQSLRDEILKQSKDKS